MFEHIHAAINARAFAIPKTKYPVVEGAREHIVLLATPDSGCCQILIDSRLKMNVMPFQVGFCLPHGLVNAAQRAAPVPGHKACGIEPSGGVALVLQHWQPHQCFNACHIGTSLVEGVFVIQRDFAQ
jgi:hypothetical protein